MAKKGGQAQLQAELNTDEDLDNFLQKSGLLLIDVYSEWCGPCLSMVPILKKIKFEYAGDTLSLAIAKSDTITAFKRFERKSEPTWLFFVNKRATNIAFGCKGPKLTKVILTELAMINSKNRKTFAPGELLPVEEEKFRAIETARLANEARIAAEMAQKRHDYLTYVTDTIMENLPDIGVTIFGTHVLRDMYKQIMQPAEKLKLQCKDRKFTTITKEQFQTINFECPNPLPFDVQDYMFEQEALVCYWKLPEGADFKILNEYLDIITSPTEEKDPETDTKRKVPPAVKQTKIKLQIELQEGEVWDGPSEESTESKPEEEAKEEEAKSEDSKEEEAGEEEAEAVENEAAAEPAAQQQDFNMMMDMPADDNADEGDAEEIVEDAEPVIRYRTKTIRMPPMWIPNNHRTHAALIYVMFRSQTQPFLPPDPVPDPPHIIMIFETYKRRDLVFSIKRNKNEIKYYGFFTSDDPNTAKHIASSVESYDKSSKRTGNDKLVVRVNKETSHMMLNLAQFNPLYVSPNVDVGLEEAKLFFPEDFKTASEELLQIAEEAEQKKPKKAGGSEPKAQPAAAPPPTEPEPMPDEPMPDEPMPDEPMPEETEKEIPYETGGEEATENQATENQATEDQFTEYIPTETDAA